MQRWQSTFLGIRAIPRDLSDFELQAFFTFSDDERRLIETRRHRGQRGQHFVVHQHEAGQRIHRHQNHGVGEQQALTESEKKDGTAVVGGETHELMLQREPRPLPLGVTPPPPRA